MNKVPYYLSLLVLTVSILLMSLSFYILYWPITVISPNTQPYRIITPDVVAGGDMTYQVDACKYLDTTGQITRRFVDEENIEFPGSMAFNSISTGCNKTNVTIPVPPYLRAGRYYLKIAVNYSLYHGLRTVSYQYTTDQFNISTPSAHLVK